MIRFQSSEISSSLQKYSASTDGYSSWHVELTQFFRSRKDAGEVSVERSRDALD